MCFNSLPRRCAAVVGSRMTPLMLVAPISAPIAEELAKALGVLLLFWLLRAEYEQRFEGELFIAGQ
jgi:RsiW-degrading membrane proteinase PrsW (M82 family)